MEKAEITLLTNCNTAGSWFVGSSVDVSNIKTISSEVQSGLAALHQRADNYWFTH